MNRGWPIIVRTDGRRPELLHLTLHSLMRSYINPADLHVCCDGDANDAVRSAVQLFRVNRTTMTPAVGLDEHLRRSTLTTAAWFYLLADDVVVSRPWALILDWLSRTTDQQGRQPGYVSGYNAPWTDPPHHASRRASILGLIDAELWSRALASWNASRGTLDGWFMTVCADAGRPPLSVERSVIQHLGIGGSSGDFNPPDPFWLGYC